MGALVEVWGQEGLGWEVKVLCRCVGCHGCVTAVQVWGVMDVYGGPWRNRGGGGSAVEA